MSRTEPIYGLSRRSEYRSRACIFAGTERPVAAGMNAALRFEQERIGKILPEHRIASRRRLAASRAEQQDTE